MSEEKQENWCMHCLIDALIQAIAVKQGRAFTREETKKIVGGCLQVTWEIMRRYADRDDTYEILRGMIAEISEEDPGIIGAGERQGHAAGHS